MGIGWHKARMRMMRYPRSLVTPFASYDDDIWGAHLGPPGDRGTQTKVVEAALKLLVEARVGGEIREFRPDT